MDTFLQLGRPLTYPKSQIETIRWTLDPDNAICLQKIRRMVPERLTNCRALPIRRNPRDNSCPLLELQVIYLGPSGIHQCRGVRCDKVLIASCIDKVLN